MPASLQSKLTRNMSVMYVIKIHWNAGLMSITLLIIIIMWYAKFLITFMSMTLHRF